MLNLNSYYWSALHITWTPTFGEFIHIISHYLLNDELMWAHPCCLTPPQVKNRYHRMRRMEDVAMCSWESRSSSPSQLWVAGSLSPYDVIIYLFCTELLLYIKVVTFVSVSWFIICVRLGLSTPGDYVRARVPKTRVWHIPMNCTYKWFWLLMILNIRMLFHS
jgi:hypothetical protein